MNNIQLFDVAAGSGGYLTRGVMRYAFFSTKPHHRSALLVEQAIHRLLDSFPPPRIDAVTNDNGDWISTDLSGLKQSASDELVGTNSGINSSISFAGSQANLPDYSIDYSGIATDRAVFKQATCVLWLSVALTAYEENEVLLHALSREIAEGLMCSTAYVSPAVVGDKRTRESLAMRYKGLDISGPRQVARDLSNKLPGIFWQTYLHKDIAQTLGGTIALESLLSSEAEIATADSGGLRIKLGTQPRFGDLNHQEPMVDYEALAHHIADHGLLHAPTKITYFDGLNEDPDEAQRRYHMRFVE